MIDEIVVQVTDETHVKYVNEILNAIAEAAKIRGTGIAKRPPEYLRAKIMDGKAVIALHGDKFVGFCYIESWSHQKYVVNSGLIVLPEYRGFGLAKAIKQKTFDLSRSKFPYAKIFGITTGLAVMKINSELGYKPVTFSELTKDDDFWKGCESCVNHDILMRTRRQHCLCTGMMYDPNWEKEKVTAPDEPESRSFLQKITDWFKSSGDRRIEKKQDPEKTYIKIDHPIQ